MSTRGRGRKKAAAKTPARHLQQPDDPAPLHAADLSLPAQPAPPPSPIIALAKQAMSPVLTLAKAAAMAAASTAATAAAALPSIPEVSVLASHSLDVAQGQDSDKPPCSTPKSSRAAAADNGHNATDDLCSPDKGTPSRQQQQAPASAHALRGRSSSPQDPADGGGAQSAAAATAADDSDCDDDPGFAAGFAARCGKLMRLRSGSAAVPAAPALLACTLLFVLVVVLGLGLRAHQANRATIALQQQQVAAQAATLAVLQQQLQQLPSLQDSASSCRSGLQQLATLQQQLNSSVAQLAGTAQQLAANVTSVESGLQQERQAWQLLSADGGAAPSPTASADEAAPTTAGAVHQPPAAGLQQDQQHAAHRRELLQREVQKQLGAALPPVNVAAQGCGARVVFHTALALAAPQQQASLQVPKAPAATSGSSGISKLLPRLQQLLLAHVLPASLAGERGQARRPQQQHLLQAQLLPRAGALSGVLLRPSGALQLRCVPLQLTRHSAALVEIQLPSPARIASITLHHPPAPAAGLSDGRGSDEAFAAWAAATPAVLTIAAVNSSSCGLGSGGPCSRAGMLLAQTGGSGPLSDDAGGASDRDAPSSSAAVQGSGAATLLADGVQATEQQVVLQPDSFAAGLARVALLGSGQQVVADRLVLLLSQNMLERHADGAGGAGRVAQGGGSGVVCLHRISVQGTPLEPASFC